MGETVLMIIKNWFKRNKNTGAHEQLDLYNKKTRRNRVFGYGKPRL